MVDVGNLSDRNGMGNIPKRVLKIRRLTSVMKCWVEMQDLLEGFEKDLNVNYKFTNLEFETQWLSPFHLSIKLLRKGNVFAQFLDVW